MSSVLVTGPESEPISLAEAKKHLNVDFTDDDDLIEAMLKAARQNAERFMGRALVSQIWDVYLDEFPRHGAAIKLKPAPVIEVLGVFYGDDSPEAEFASAGYRLDRASAPARLSLVSGGSWPTITCTENAVRIRIRAGYVDDEVSPPTGEVPYDIRAGILLNLGTLYANRESVLIGQTNALRLPWAAEQLLMLHRIETGMA